MKIYNKPELNAEQFDVIDILTVSGNENGNVNAGNSGDIADLSAGLEFDVNVAGDEF